MRYRHHKYTWEKPFNSIRHNWEFVGARGGVNFHATITPEYGASCGLEFHYRTPPTYMADNAPSHVQCSLLKCACWHDGTTLYAEDHVWPTVKAMLTSGDHEAIFRLLEQEADKNFGYHKEAENDEIE